ncbi:RNA polymerase sigma factor [Methyloligella solikamskensis]|uniref:RNA polymerase sigma factor n=1 Tax=Methyloligella solikamskensis TaxID=1177756 RepID=A0ABW3J6L3_9HYPH
MGETETVQWERSDDRLVAAAVSGDRAAFAALLERHYDRIHRIAWRNTGSREDAEDIAQEICCGLVTKLGSFRGDAKFTTWLTGIVMNACRDHFRRKQARARLMEGAANVAALTPRPDGRDLYRRSWLASDLAALDESLRETVILVAGEELSHAEAAKLLGIAESTVSWRMHEARRKLKGEGTDDDGS